jgi:hypothetical protein
MKWVRTRWRNGLGSTGRIALTGAMVLLFAGCGGGAGGGLGSGQSPDPVVQDFPIAYVKRPIPLDDQGNIAPTDVRRPMIFNAGGDLYVRDRASPSALERNVTDRFTGGLGDVKDVEISYDGSKLLFAMRAPEIEGAAPEDQPTWNIWEYEIASDNLRRVIASDITAEAGQDIAPHYLPDGRIIFSSTRQRQTGAIELDEGKPQYPGLTEDLREPALVLHVMNADGSDLHQISFNQSHDLDPTVMADGEVLFSRWDHMGSTHAINLYRMHPDGTELQLLYGAHSHATGTDGSTVQFVQPREIPDGRIMTLLVPFATNNSGGDVVTIDTPNYIDNDQPTWTNQGVVSGSAQASATGNNVRTDSTPSPGGRFSAAYPLWDGTNRAIVSWSPCRLMENGTIVPCTPERLAAPNAQEAPPLYGIYIYNMTDNTQLPVVVPEEGVVISDVVAAQPRRSPPILYDKVGGLDLTQEYLDEGVGVLDIRSVYDFGNNSFNGCFLTDCTTATNINTVADLADPAKATADQRPARFLRIVKAVPIPDDTVLDFPNTAFGRSRQQLMREIIGYVPIEPDGSVKAKVPANVPLAISVLDKNGRRIGARHQNWLQVRPGETVVCNGCHTHATANQATPLPHGRQDAVANSINSGSQTTGQPFPNTVATFWTDFGETMAETRTRIDPAALTPSVDVVYDDVWTDAAAAARGPDASFSYRYSDYANDPAYPIAAPTSTGCLTKWTNTCRIVINYEQHIHPLWNKPRPVLDGAGTVIDDHRCTRCHNDTDEVNQVPQVPAAQLDLSDGPSSDEPDHFKSYRELLFPDNEQELVNGVLQDKLVQATDAAGNPLFQTDANGDPILDAAGNPIPVMVPVPAPGPSMSTASARAGYFLSKFDAGGSHEGWLSDAEKRLISEWLDVGAQYYNNPFDIPTGN